MKASEVYRQKPYREYMKAPFRDTAPGAPVLGTIFGTLVFVLLIAVWCRLAFWHGHDPVVIRGDALRVYYEALHNHRGELIYRDFSESAQPGMMFLFEAWSRIFGFSIATLNGLVTIIVVMFGVVLLTVGRTMMSSGWSYLAAAIPLFVAPWFGLATYHWVATLLLLIALLIIEPLEKHDRSMSVSRAALAGVTCGCAFVTMQSEGLLGGAAIAVWILWRHGKRRTGAFILAATLPFLLVTVHFALQGAAVEYLRNTFWNPLRRTPKGTWQGPQSFLASWQGLLRQPLTLGSLYQVGIALFLTLGAPLACAAAVLSRRASPRIRLCAVLSLAGLASVAYGPSVDRLMVALSSFVVAATWISRTRMSRAAQIIGFVLLAVVAIHPVIRLRGQPLYAIDDRVGGGQVVTPVMSSAVAARWVLQRTRKGDAVALYPWSFEEIMFLGDLRKPGRVWWMDEGGFTSPVDVRDVLLEVARQQPQIAGWSPLEDLAGNRIPIVFLAPLYEYIRRCYSPAVVFEESVLYERSAETRGCDEAAFSQ